MPLVLNPISGEFDFKGVDYVSQSRAPTSADNSYSPPYGWLDTTNDNFYILVDVTNGTATWDQIGAAGGDVSGPGSSTDNAITRWDGTGGDTIQNSVATLDDSGFMTVPSGGTSGTPTAGYFFADGDTGLYEHIDDNIRVQVNGTDTWIMSSVFGGLATGSARIYSTGSQVVFSFVGDANTGMGRIGAQTLGFFTGTVEALRLDASQNATFAGTVTADGGTFDAGGLTNTNVNINGSTDFVLRATATDTFVLRDATAGADRLTLDSSGNFTLGGTFDGRDISADGAVLDTAILDADFGSNGVMTRTASGTYTSRTITGTSNEISVSDGDGVSGNPTLSLPSTIDLGGKTLEIPNGASFAPSAVGQFGLDTSITDYTPLLKYHDGTEEFSVVAMPTANLGTDDGYVVSYNATNDEFELVASGGGSGDVTAASNMTDHAIIRGDGGAKGVQDSGITISDADLMTIPSGGTAGIRFGDGDTGMYETSDDFLEFYVGGTEVMRLLTGGGSAHGVNFGNGSIGTAYIPAEFASATNPVYSFFNDLDTGIGSSGANALSLITGGTEALRIDSSQNLILTNDLGVDDGGTGRSSHTAYAVICGGTTSTGAQQSVSGVGTEGQVLESQGASALPQWANRLGLVPIETQTVSSNVSSVDFTTGIDSTYGIYLLTGYNVVPDTGTNDLYVRFSTDGGSTWESGASDYKWTHFEDYSTWQDNEQSNGDSEIVIISGTRFATSNDREFGFNMWIYNPSNASDKTSCEFNVSGCGDVFVRYTGGGSYDTADNIDGIQILPSANNIASGTFTLWGLAAS